MKKTMLIAAVLAVAACVVARAQTEVLSQNAVGYIKIEVANNLTTISMPFDAVGYGTIYFTNSIGLQVTGAGAYFYEWNGTNWVTYTSTRSWQSASNLVLAPGTAYILQRPTAWSGTSNIVISGQVPDATNTVRSIRGSNNLTMISFSYPTEESFTNTTLAKSTGGSGAYLYAWNGISWVTYNSTRSWQSASNLVLHPGVGYFFQAGASTPSFDWNVTKPYTWP